MIQAIAFDLDGTLLNGKGQISPLTGQVLHSLHDLGIHLIVASGRSYTSLPQDIRGFEGFEFAVTTNGAATYHMPNHTALIRHTLDKGRVEDLLTFTRDMPVGYEFYADGRSYTERRYLDNPESYGLSQQVMAYIRRTRQPVDHIDRFVADHDLDGMSLSIGDPKLKKEIWGHVSEAFPDLNLTASIPRLIEITDAKASKGQGLQDVLNHLKLEPSTLMAFGDGWNDRSMLALAGHGVAMANAMVGVDEVADGRCGHHHEDGVASYVIDYFNLPLGK